MQKKSNLHSKPKIFLTPGQQCIIAHVDREAPKEYENIKSF